MRLAANPRQRASSTAWQAAGRRGGGPGGRGAGWRASGVSHQSSEASQPSPAGGGGWSRQSGLAGRAAQADMHVAVMAAPGPHPAQPGGAGIAAAELALDGVVDEDAVDARQFGRQPDQRGMARRSSAPGRCRSRPAGPGREPGYPPVPRPSGPASARAPARYRHPARPGGWHGHRASARRAAGRDRRSRGWAKPCALARPARSRSVSSRAGWPQLRLRESRTACQPGPSGGNATAPAMQPRPVWPMIRGGPAGPGTAPAVGPGPPPPPSRRPDQGRARRSRARAAARIRSAARRW